MFVYIIINDVNNKIYIGKTVTSDLEAYFKTKITDSKNPKYTTGSHLHPAMRKYGPEHFHIYPLVIDCISNEALCVWEQILIAQFNSQNPDYGYNICKGGEGFTGPHSEESRKKTSESGKRAWRTDSKRRKSQSIRMQGNLYNPECRIPQESRKRGGATGGVSRSEAKICQCRSIARLGGQTVACKRWQIDRNKPCVCGKHLL